MNFLSFIIVRGTSIVEVPLEVYEKLELNDIFTGLLRSFGQFIYDITSFLLNGVEDAFNLLVRFDISSMPFIEGMQIEIQEIIYSIMLLAFLITLFINLLQVKPQMKLVYNIAMASLAISCFFGVIAMLQEFKNTGMNQIDLIVQREENEKMSERIFKMNTWDMVKSVEDGQLILIEESAELGYVSLGSTMADDVLGEKIVGTDPMSGEPIVMDVNQGIGGYGDERYFMVTADLVAINVTILIILIVYLFGIIKIASLVAELLNLLLTGTPVMATSVNSLSRIQVIYTMALQNVLGFFFVYFGMNVYTLVIDANFKNQLTTSWLANVILLFVSGAVLLLGGDAVMKKLGIDGGTSGMARAGGLLWGAARVNRSIKRGFKGFGNYANSLNNGFNSIGDWAKGTTTESPIPKTEYGSVHFENPETQAQAQDTTKYQRIENSEQPRLTDSTSSYGPQGPSSTGPRNYDEKNNFNSSNNSNNSKFARYGYSDHESENKHQPRGGSKFEHYREHNDVQKANDYNIKQNERRASSYSKNSESQKEEPRKIQYKGKEFEQRNGKYYSKSNINSKSYDKMMPDWYFEDYVSEQNTNTRDVVDGKYRTDLDEKIDSRMNELSGNVNFNRSKFDIKAFEKNMKNNRQGGEHYGDDS